MNDFESAAAARPRRAGALGACFRSCLGYSGELAAEACGRFQTDDRSAEMTATRSMDRFRVSRLLASDGTRSVNDARVYLTSEFSFKHKNGEAAWEFKDGAWECTILKPLWFGSVAKGTTWTFFKDAEERQSARGGEASSTREVELPVGALGIIFELGSTRICKLREGSPLRGRVSPGERIVALTYDDPIDNGIPSHFFHECARMTDTELAELLDRHKHEPGRRVTVQAAPAAARASDDKTDTMQAVWQRQRQRSMQAVWHAQRRESATMGAVYGALEDKGTADIATPRESEPEPEPEPDLEPGYCSCTCLVLEA